MCAVDLGSIFSTSYALPELCQEGPLSTEPGVNPEHCQASRPNKTKENKFLFPYSFILLLLVALMTEILNWTDLKLGSNHNPFICWVMRHQISHTWLWHWNSHIGAPLGLGLAFGGMVQQMLGAELS